MGAQKSSSGVRWFSVGPDEPRFVDDRDGVVVLTRRSPGEAGSGGAVEGAGFLMRGCTNPDCECTEVSLLGAAFGPGTEAVGFDVNERAVDLRCPGAPERESNLSLLSLTLDLASGEIAPKAGEEPAVDLDWLRNEMTDGVLLDRLWTAFLTAKGFADPAGPAPADELPDFEPGEKVYYSSVFPGVRPDGYHVGDRDYLLSDVHCPKPSCRCDLVTLDVQERSDDAPPRSIGYVELTISAPRFEPAWKPRRRLDFVPDRGADRALLEDLFERFRRRYPSGDARLRERQERVRAVLRPVFEASEGPSTIVGNAVTAGRNDPCPCGSGKKFKKCCGAVGSGR